MRRTKIALFSLLTLSFFGCNKPHPLSKHIIIDVVDIDGKPIPGTLVTGYEYEFFGPAHLTHLNSTNTEGRVLWPRDWRSLKIQLSRNGYSSRPLSSFDFEYLQRNDVVRTFVLYKPGYAHFNLDPDFPWKNNHSVECVKSPLPEEPPLNFTLSRANPEFVAMIHDTNHLNEYRCNLYDGDEFIREIGMYIITPDVDTTNIWINPNP